MQKPMTVLVTFISWDVSTSTRLTLPNRREYTIPCSELERQNIVDNWNWSKQKSLDEHRLGDYILTRLCGEYGYAIKQIQYEILDYGDCPHSYA